MGNRLSKITTRTGDDGSTGLGDGSRVRKSSVRVAALGEIDELNCQIGVLQAEVGEPEVQALLTRVQNELFDLGGEVSIPGHHMFADSQVSALDQAITYFNADLPPLKEFVLPGGSRASAQAHVARAVARRAERALVALAERETVSAPALQYLNRLSDLLFILARQFNRRAGTPDILWLRQDAPMVR